MYENPVIFRKYLLIFRKYLLIFRKNPVIFRTLPVIFRRKSVLFRIKPAIFRINPFIFRTNPVMFMTRSDAMSKQGEKRSTSKTYIYMKKYERINDIYMVFAVFTINLVFETVSAFVVNSQKRTIKKKCKLKNNIIFFLSRDIKKYLYISDSLKLINLRFILSLEKIAHF